MSLRLTLELVPQTAWGGNLRKVLSKTEWDTIRKETFDRDGHRCIYCGDPKRLHCHEVWGYDDDTQDQYLEDTQTVCAMCHHIKHLGFAELLCHQGKLDKQALINHFCKVNQCSEQVFHDHRYASFQQWAARSKRPWRTNIMIDDLIIEIGD